MESSELHLRQAEEAIKYADRAHQDLKQAFKDFHVPEKAPEEARPAYGQVIDALDVYDRTLALARSVTGLYAGQYPTELHRATRVVGLLDKCCRAHRKVSDAYAAFAEYRFHGAKNGVGSTDWHFRQSGTMVDIARRSLHSTSTNCVTDLVENKPSSDHEPASSLLESGQHISAFDYCKPASRYGWPKNARDMAGGLSYDDRCAMVIEKTNPDVAFQRLSTSSKSRYGDIDVTPVSCNELHFDCINAVLQSPMAPELAKKTDAAFYQTVTDEVAMNSTYGEVDALCLAKSMSNWNIVVGVIFSDDLSVIIWPIGKELRKTSVKVVVYSMMPPELGGNYYEAIQPLEPGMRPSPKSGNTVIRPYIRTENQMHRIEKFNGTALPIPSQPHSKPLPFLRLPAELRNKIYAHYLRYKNDDASRWTWGRLRGEHIPIPELSQTCRQLRDEVLPMFIASASISCYIRKGQNTRYYHPFRSSLLSDYNLSLAKLPVLANFADIIIHLPPSRSGSAFKTLRIQKTEQNYTCTLDRAPSQLQHGHPQVSAQHEELQRLLNVLAEDRRTAGLSLFDITAIEEFLFRYCESTRASR